MHDKASDGIEVERGREKEVRNVVEYDDNDTTHRWAEVDDNYVKLLIFEWNETVSGCKCACASTWRA